MYRLCVVITSIDTVSVIHRDSTRSAYPPSRGTIQLGKLWNNSDRHGRLVQLVWVTTCDIDDTILLHYRLGSTEWLLCTEHSSFHNIYSYYTAITTTILLHTHTTTMTARTTNDNNGNHQSFLFISYSSSCFPHELTRTQTDWLSRQKRKEVFFVILDSGRRHITLGVFLHTSLLRNTPRTALLLLETVTGSLYCSSTASCC